MSAVVAITRAAATIDTAPYTQDITTADLGGLTPVAAIVIMCRADVDGTAEDHANMSVGFVASTTERMMGSFVSEHGVTTTNIRFELEADEVVTAFSGGDVADREGIADIDSFITDGIRLNWTTVPDDNWLITVIFFAGTDVTAKLEQIDLGNVVQVVDVTTVGFTPDVVFSMAQDGSAPSMSSGALEAAFGFSHFDGVSTVVDRVMLHNSLDGQSTQVLYGWMREDAAVMAVLGNGNIDWWASTQDYDASGFSYNVQNRGANNTDVIYLALNFGGVIDAWVGTHVTPTATGNDGETGPGFVPQAVVMLPSGAEVAATEYGDNRAGTWGWLAFDEDDEYCNTNSEEDAAGTMNTQSLSDDVAVNVPDDDGAALQAATFVSLDANGWTLNWSAVAGTAKRWPAIAFEEEAAPAVGQPTMIRTQGVPTGPGYRDRAGGWN